MHTRFWKPSLAPQTLKPQGLHSFIHSFNNYLVNASYAPSTVPGSENTEVNETNQLATLSDFTF